MESAVLKSLPRLSAGLGCLLFSLCSSAFAQNIDARPAGGVGAGCLVSLSLISAIEAANPAAVALSDGLTAAVGGVLPFGLADLAEVAGAADVPTPLAHVGVRVGRSGGELSHYCTFGGWVARRWGRVSAGVAYYGVTHSLAYAESGASSYSVMGVAVRPADAWLLSLTVKNVEGRGLRRAGREEDIPTTLWAAASWRAPLYFTLCAELEKESGREAVAHIGVSLQPCERLRFTAGFSSLGRQICAGVGYDWVAMGVHASVAHHFALGVTSAALLTFHPQWL